MPASPAPISNASPGFGYGDFQLFLDLDNNQVINAWSKNGNYRGFDAILTGRGPLDGLVLAPRISMASAMGHLLAAAMALETLAGVTPPANALIIRNLALLAETVQSDLRCGIMFFMKDFLNPAYSSRSFYLDAWQRYQMLRGKSMRETVRMSKKILEVVALFGGQWPNSAFMIPGGISSNPKTHDLINCRFIIDHFRAWYEERVLGCPIEHWQEIHTAADLQYWMNEKQSHFTSEVGTFIRLAYQTNLPQIGGGYGNFLSFSQLQQPELFFTDKNDPRSPAPFSAGIFHKGKKEEFTETAINEHVRYSYFQDYSGGKHPAQADTTPSQMVQDVQKYSFYKAPRYGSYAMETGPLAEMLTDGDPLFLDVRKKQGVSCYLRQLARLVRPARLLPAMQQLLSEIEPGAPYYLPTGGIPDGASHGLINNGCGAIGHWMAIDQGRISRYHIISPAAWNGSPRDDLGKRGPWEEAVVGTVLADPENPVEIYHIIRSFDPTQAFSVTVHQR